MLRFVLYICCFVVCPISSILAQSPPVDTAKVNEQLDSLDAIWGEYMASGKYKEALVYAQQSYALSQKSRYADTTTGPTQYAIARLLEELNEYKEAIKNYEEACQKLKGHKYYVYPLNDLGLLYMHLEDMDKAETLLQKSLKLRGEIYGEQDAHYATGLNNLAQLYKKQGAYERAITLYEQAAKKMKASRGEESVQYLSILNNIAKLENSIDNHDKAERLYLEIQQRAREKYQESDPFTYSTYLANLASFYQEQQRYGEAEKLSLEVLALRRVLGEEHQSYQKTLAQLVGIYKATKRYEEAEAYLQKLLALREKTLGRKHSSYLKALMKLAGLYAQKGQFEQAKKTYFDCLDLSKDLQGEDALLYVQNLLSTAWVSQQLKEYDEAEVRLRGAWYVLEDQPDLSEEYTLQTQLALSELYMEIKDYERAVATLKISFQGHVIAARGSDLVPTVLKQELRDYEYPKIALRQIELLSSLYRENGKLQDDKKLLDTSQVLLIKLFLLYEQGRIDFRAEGDKLSFHTRVQNQLAEGLKTASILSEERGEEAIEQAFLMAEYNKAILLADANRSNRAQHFGVLPDSLVNKERALQKEMDYLEKRILDSKTSVERKENRKKLNSLSISYDAFRNEIRYKYPEYYTQRYSSFVSTAQDIRKLLAPDELFIEYVLTEEGLYIFSLSKEKIVLDYQEMPLDSFKYHLELFRKSLSQHRFIFDSSMLAYQMYIDNAYWLYQHSLEGILKKHEGIKHLLIVPDLGFAHVPFEAFLQSPAKNHNEMLYSQLDYLIRDYSLSYNYSASFWKSLREQKPKKHNQQIFAMASSYGVKPQYDSLLSTQRNPMLQTVREHLPELPAARREVQWLAQHFAGEFLFDLDANEKNFKEAAMPYAVLHLAMHGLLNERQPMLSSLIFSEDFNTKEDNILEAWEVSHLQLDAQLVVLSACETGYGRFERNEGVISLARAFMYAGVPSIIMTMWQVNDASTAQLMPLFYQELNKGLRKNEALRRAKISYIESADELSAHPMFWSALVHYGDVRPIQIRSKAWPLYFWLLACLPFPLLYWLFYRKRQLSPRAAA